MALEEKSECKKPPSLFPSTRLSVYLMLCSVAVMNIVIRYGFNMTLVCMVVPPGQVDSNFTDLSAGNDSAFSDITDQAQCDYGAADGAGKDFGFEGEFTWSRAQVGHIVSGYYYGYLPMQLLSGWLADRFGVRHVVGIGTLVGGVLSLLTPVAARLHYGVLIALRIVMGFTMGTIFPSFSSFIGKWVPLDERITFNGVLFSGPAAGSMLAFSLSGIMCQYSWTLPFYVFGSSVLLWYVAHMYFVYSTPEEHPRISDEEKDYIMQSNNLKGKQTKLKTPWRSILTSPSVIGACVTHFTLMWIVYTVGVGIPLYLQDVLYFNIKTNGVLSSLGPLTNLCLSLPIAIALDYIYRNLVKSTFVMRRLCMSMYALLAIASVVAVGFMQCDQRIQAIVLYCLISFSYTFVRGGVTLTALDIAPKFAGTVYGLMNFVGQFAGLLAPIAIGNMTPTGSQAEWQRVFFLTAGIITFGWLVFMFFVSAVEQEWAKGNDVVFTQVPEEIDDIEKVPHVINSGKDEFAEKFARKV